MLNLQCRESTGCYLPMNEQTSFQMLIVCQWPSVPPRQAWSPGHQEVGNGVDVEYADVGGRPEWSQGGTLGVCSKLKGQNSTN